MKFEEVDGQTLGLHGASRSRGCDLVNYLPRMPTLMTTHDM